MATDVAPSPAEIEPETPPIGVGPDRLYEVVDGRAVEKAMGAYEVQTARLLLYEMLNYVLEHALGAVEMEVLFLIDPASGLKRRPDVAFVSKERWPLGRRAPRQEAWDVVPDLMVEVVSPTNTASEVMRKVNEYRRAGGRLVWVVYPVEGAVQVYEPGGTARVLGREDALDGGEVLPGFRLPLASLFEEEAGATGPAA